MVKTSAASHKKKTMILSASEIGQYSYCALSWYLQRLGYHPDSAALYKGKKMHYELGNTLDTIQKETKKAWRYFLYSIVLILLVCLLLLVAEVIV